MPSRDKTAVETLTSESDLWNYSMGPNQTNDQVMMGGGCFSRTH
jgi:hypothetical protein